MIDMDNVDKCKLICGGIEDEKNGQEYYRKLIKEFPHDKVALTPSLNDEIKHEKTLNIIKNGRLPDCSCEK